LIETLRLNVDGSVSTLPVGDDEMSVEEDAEAREEEEGEEEVRNDGSRSDGARKGWLWRQNEEPELYSEETREETPEAKRFIAEMGTLHFEQVKAGQIVPAGELAYVLPGACAHLAKHHQRRVSGQSVIIIARVHPSGWVNLLGGGGLWTTSPRQFKTVVSLRAFLSLK
jgi:hypothetical protein